VETSPIILCEGEDDEEFFNQLIKNRGLPLFDVRGPRQGDISGKTGFKSRLVSLKTETGLETRSAVIIVRDNDIDPPKEFLDLAEQIRSAGGYGVPEGARRLTTAQQVPLPPICVLMLPWDDQRGALETLCYKAAAEKRADIARCVEEYVRCVQSEEWSPVKLDKLRMRCLLSGACPTEPNTHLKWAWKGTRGRPIDLIPLDHPCFDEIANFLAGLA